MFDSVLLSAKKEQGRFTDQKSLSPNYQCAGSNCSMIEAMVCTRWLKLSIMALCERDRRPGLPFTVFRDVARRCPELPLRRWHSRMRASLTSSTATGKGTCHCLRVIGMLQHTCGVIGCGLRSSSRWQNFAHYVTTHHSNACSTTLAILRHSCSLCMLTPHDRRRVTQGWRPLASKGLLRAAMYERLPPSHAYLIQLFCNHAPRRRCLYKIHGWN